ncbi:MAG: CRISPR-associated endonuclease Cas1 [Paenibacillus sp.]|nr:CRISPR-associated endonuclease Cas1 [Paenibacillus sp.]
MSVLYAATGNSRLEYEDRCIVVYRDGKRFSRFPSLKLDKIVVFGNVDISTQVINHCLQEGIDIVFLSNNGRYFGRLQGPETKNPDVRRVQYQISSDESKCLEFAKIFIAAKIHNCRVVLQRHREEEESFGKTIKLLGDLKDKAQRAKSLPELRGIEGIASKEYFSHFNYMTPKEFVFPGRKRRPPTDPINSLLSFGYTLLVYDMFSAVAEVGLDPYLGILHEDKYGRPSIALDLIEEYRPIIVDLLVLMVLNKKVLQPQDFYTSDEGAVLLTDEGRKKFLEQYEKRMLTETSYKTQTRLEKTTYRRTILRQAYSLVRAFKGEDEYRPMMLK